MKFKIFADVLYSHEYEIEATTKAIAMEKVVDEELDPLRKSMVTSPVIVHIEEIKKK